MKLGAQSNFANDVFFVGALLKEFKRGFAALVAIGAATAKSLQSSPTLCDPIPRILQARTLEWVAISFSSCRN